MESNKLKQNRLTKSVYLNFILFKDLPDGIHNRHKFNRNLLQLLNMVFY